ncbi:hypothetical protein LCGC14_2639020, partial [marine sediment metagenome]
TSGYGLAGGFRDAARTPKLAAVTCQECPRFTLGKPTSPDTPCGAPPIVTEEACTLCHTPRTSPKFDFKAYRLRVGCVAPGDDSAPPARRIDAAREVTVSDGVHTAPRILPTGWPRR